MGVSAWWNCPGPTDLISQLRMLSDLAPARISGGCWGFNGPIPPPLWMSVVCVFNCGGHCAVLDQEVQDFSARALRSVIAPDESNLTVRSFIVTRSRLTSTRCTL